LDHLLAAAHLLLRVGHEPVADRGGRLDLRVVRELELPILWIPRQVFHGALDILQPLQALVVGQLDARPVQVGVDLVPARTQ